MTVRLAGCVVIVRGVIPVPLRETAIAELVASLARAMLPESLPGLGGANWSWNAWFCPAAMETEDIPPKTLNPVPVMVACEMVTIPEPVLLKVKVWELLLPTGTFPKLKLVELVASVPFPPDLTWGVPAPVNPTQPEREKAAISAVKTTIKPRGAG